MKAKTIRGPILVTIFSSLFFVSCNRAVDEIPTIINNPNGDYFPTAVNNSWKFQDSNNVNYSSLKQIGIQNLNGYTYSKFDQVGEILSWNGNEQILIRKDGGNYYVRVPETETETVANSGYEYTLLKDNVPVNTTWSGSFTWTTTTTLPGYPSFQDSDIFKYEAKILAKDVQAVVNGKTVNNIIKVRYSFINTSNYDNYKGVEIWYAKNIGIVKYTENMSRFEVFSELKEVKLY